MKKLFSSIAALGVIAILLLARTSPAAAQSFTPNANQVCFYEHENYGGAYICISSSGEYADLGRYFVGTSNNN